MTAASAVGFFALVAIVVAVDWGAELVAVSAEQTLGKNRPHLGGALLGDFEAEVASMVGEVCVLVGSQTSENVIEIKL